MPRTRPPSAEQAERQRMQRLAAERPTAAGADNPVMVQLSEQLPPPQGQVFVLPGEQLPLAPVAPGSIKTRHCDEEAYSAGRIAEVLGLLAANNGRYRETARATGIPEATIRRWFREQRDDRRRERFPLDPNLQRQHPTAAEIADKSAELREACREVALRCVRELLGPNGLADAKPQAKAVITGIMTEKFLLLSQQATTIRATAVLPGGAQLNLDALNQEQLRTFEQLLELMGGSLPAGSIAPPSTVVDDARSDGATSQDDTPQGDALQDDTGSRVDR